jgi:RNA polymerase sigma-70 factor (ECF subfamily)
MAVAAEAPAERPGLDPRVVRAASGDRAAAEALLVELLPRVRNLVRYLVRGDSEADDIAQHALLAILRGFHSYRGEGSLSSWVDRVTAREALARVRRARSERSRYEREPPDLQAVPSGDAPPDAYLERREAVRRLDALPVEQRTAVVLHVVAGFSVPELAKELGIPFETARSRIRLGMKKLREGQDAGEHR